MSRFFARGSDSESSSEEEELYGTSSDEASQQEASEDEDEDKDEEDQNDSDEDEDDEEDNSDEDSDEEAGAKGVGFYKRNAFLKGAGGGSDDDSDDDKRVVKSAKDKLLDEIDAGLKSTENAKKINDWISISESFDKANKLVDRAQKQYQTVPKRYIKWLVELDEFSQETTKSEKEKDTKKRMNKSNSQSFNSVKQRLKKTLREHETLVTAFKADGDDFMAETPSQSAAPSASKASKAPATSQDATALATDEDGFSTVGKGGKAVLYTPENLIQSLIGIAENRGKKNVDRQDQIRILDELRKIADTNAYHLISVLLLTVSVRFDATAGGQVLSTKEWKAAEEDIQALFDTLEGSAEEYRVSASASEPEDIEVGPVAGPDGIKVISGSVSSLIEKLDDELTKALQSIDPHTTEYVDRLRDESGLYNLILRAQLYLEAEVKAVENLKSRESDPLSRILVRRLEHVYFKPTSVIITGEQEAWTKLPATLKSQGSILTPHSEVVAGEEQKSTTELVSSICQALYQQENTTFRTKAMLCHIYHYALNDLYFQARDMFLMSHLQSSIHTAESSVQVLFNRALVQVGLCAFKLGLISECQQSLAEICSSSKLKELLGQGVTKYSQGNFNQQQQQQIAERQRLLPFHMHINLELLECIYLTSSLLIEVPLMGATINANQSLTAAEAKKKIVSKPFRRMLDYHDRQVFTGPPENTRDHIMQAASALLNGDWAIARDLLISIKIWSLLPNTEEIKEMLTLKVQEEGLKTYLFMYGSSCYQSLSLTTLADLFGMPTSRTSAIVSKLIANEEIAAALDQTNNTMVFRQGVQNTKLQSLALALSEKAVQLAERNERLAAGGYQLESNSDNTSGQQQNNSSSSGSAPQQHNNSSNQKPNTNRRPQQQRPQQRTVRA